MGEEGGVEEEMKLEGGDKENRVIFVHLFSARDSGF